jgi:F-type H+-transporting ATPase subunit delta
MKTTKRTKRDARQLFRFCLRDGLLDEARAQQLVQRILQSRSRDSLALLTAFEEWVKLDQAQHAARVESAKSLPPESANQVRATLAETYGPGLNVSFAENAALIGGMRVTVGSDVYDGSVRGRLSTLEERFS